MKVLLDGCVWGGAREALATVGHDVEATADWRRDPGDDELLAHAFRQAQVLITLDKDFGELAVVKRRPHVGIVRLVDLRAEDQGQAAIATLARYGEELSRGAIVTVEPGRVRVRPADREGVDDT
ncbi:MAG: toxin-antitoxin system, toxin component, PIN family protein [Acidobacteria bacterium RIFCSPLOWO2_02_FULL_60_20]|nr:MAG: toxin-antitoxin system, toxin component, PIN family protein [Acidobacteria bacterium RIFCSPLOWO2_02_FULL_60_20]OFW07339.1 MAG: toxin-antitoxin system, toxin component, PIN family protein [Acidobacteria bacterium RIFCSPLOWO2_12_FULL_59_11]